MAIGVKTADGNFYPLINENSIQKKKVKLCPAHPGQEKMKISLFKSADCSMNGAVYVGGFLFECVRGAREPLVELLVASNGTGQLSAHGQYRGTGETRDLNVNLESMQKSGLSESTADVFGGGGDEDFGGGSLISAGLFDIKPARRLRLLPLVAVIALIAAVIGAGLFLFRNKSAGAAQAAEPQPSAAAPPPDAGIARQESAQPQPSPQTPSAQTPADAGEPPLSPPAAQETARKRNPPVRRFSVPAVIPREGIGYRVRWEDTLWDIADVFYRNPRLYRRLARYNRVRNPDVIIPGSIIRIPPRNKLP